MARKNLLISLTDAELPAGNSLPEKDSGQDAAPHIGVMGTRGAIGAVTRSIEQLKAHSVVDLPPDLIDASFINDRLDHDPQSHAELTVSMREHGQQVPILVRPHPTNQGRYQIVYGRRRLRAATQLGLQIKAIVRPLSDAQLVVAQGQENSARTDLSFIEKALFAAKLEEGGFDRETIMASLTVDKTGLSRLISAAVKVPRDIIEAIGPAPKTGRDRWIELATRLEASDALTRARKAVGGGGLPEKVSDERFVVLFNAAAPVRAKKSRAAVLNAPDGSRIGRFKDEEGNLTLEIDKRHSGGFAAYLLENLPDLYTTFKKQSKS